MSSIGEEFILSSAPHLSQLESYTPSGVTPLLPYTNGHVPTEVGRGSVFGTTGN